MQQNNLPWPALSRGLVGKEIFFADPGPSIPAQAIPIAQATRQHKLIDVASLDYRDARPLTIQLFSDDESDTPPGFTALPFGNPGGWLADLEWGTDAFSSRAQFHVGAGAQLTVVGAAVRLSVRWDDEVHPLSNIGAPHVVGAQLGLGNRPAFNAPLELSRSWVTSVVTVNADPFEVGTVKIPRFARSVLPGAFITSTGNLDNGAFQLVFRDSRGRTIHSHRLALSVEAAVNTTAAFLDSAAGSLPIPPGAVWLGAAIIDITAGNADLQGAFARFEISI